MKWEQVRQVGHGVSIALCMDRKTAMINPKHVFMENKKNSVTVLVPKPDIIYILSHIKYYHIIHA